MIAIADLETTGLDSERHEPWEHALLLDDGEGPPIEHLWRWMPDLSEADPNALRMNGFYDRSSMLSGAPLRQAERSVAHWCGSPITDSTLGDAEEWVPVDEAARHMATLTAGQVLTGAVPSFDERMLAPWLKANGWPGAWHYRPVCIETLVAGHLGITEWPWDSNELSRAIGVDPADFDRHSAMGDVRWGWAMLQAWRLAPRAGQADQPKRRSTRGGVVPGQPSPKPPLPDPARIPGPVRAVESDQQTPAPDPALTPELVDEPAAPVASEAAAEPEPPSPDPHDVRGTGLLSAPAPTAATAPPDLMPPGWPREGDDLRCHECGDVIEDLDQARASWSVFQVALDRKCHVARAAITSG